MLWLKGERGARGTAVPSEKILKGQEHLYDPCSMLEMLFFTKYKKVEEPREKKMTKINLSLRWYQTKQ